MAAEAILWFAFPELSPNRLFQVLWSEALVSSRDLQTINRWIVAHHAFEEFSPPVEDPCLGSFAEAPVNGQGDGLSPVSDGICSLAAMGLDRVGVHTFCEFKRGMGFEQRVVLRPLHAASHR